MKFEIRNPKSETNSKFQIQMTETAHGKLSVARFRSLGFGALNLFRISNFGFRISSCRAIFPAAAILLLATSALAQPAHTQPRNPNPLRRTRVAPPPATAPATRPAVPAERQKLARDLLQHARIGERSADVRRFVQRAEVLARLALREDPGLAEAWQLIAEAKESQRDLSAAAEAQGQYLKELGRTDYEGTLRWMRYQLATIQTAGKRLTALKEIAEATGRPEAERAAAWANVGVILENDGRLNQALVSYREALRLEPTERAALEGLARLEEPYGPVEQAAGSVALLRGNPLAVNVAWELGQLCRQHGLYDQAVQCYDYAEAVARITDHYPSSSFRRDMLDALLDAGLAQRAVDEFASELEANPPDLGTLSLLAEAYRQLGQAEALEQVVVRMQEVYSLRQTVAKVPGPLAAELAWFNMRFRDRQLPARNWADMAMQKSPEDGLARRVWGQLYLQSTDAQQAERARQLLEELSAGDAYALADLLDDLVRRGQNEQARQRIADVQNLPRQGPGWRYLAAVAARHGLPLTARTEPGEQVAARVETFFTLGYASLALEPEKHIQVSLEGPSQTVLPGQPIVFTAVLSNVGRIPVPLGEWGLLTPRMVVTAKAEAGQGRDDDETRVPVLWAAPRFLQPGQSLRQPVRVDVEGMEALLARRLLDEVKLTVGGIIDPMERRGKLAAGVKPIEVPAVVVTRAALVAEPAREAYDQALARLEQMLHGTEPQQQLQAAGTITQLAALLQAVHGEQLMPAGALTPYLREAQVQEMLRFCLQETVPPVRAATLMGLSGVKVTDKVVKLMAPCLADAEPVIRALAVDLLGRQDPARFRDILLSFAEKDPDELVRQMARWATTPAATPATTPAATQPAEE